MRRSLVALVLLVTLVLLAACSGGGDEPSAEPSSSSSSAASSATPSAAPRPVPPRNGTCHRLTIEQALAPTAEDDPVRCKRPHTSRTFKVGRLDRGVEVDSDAAQRTARETCTARLGSELGADREQLRLSLLATVWFTPTLEEAAAGGRWFRCDLIATAGDGRLLRLPRDLDGVLGDLALCATAEPGTKGSRRVPCSRPHAWRALATVDLPGKAYPSAEQAAGAMDDTCRSRARAAAADPLDFTWSEERPTRPQWRAGQRYGLCWAPD